MRKWVESCYLKSIEKAKEFLPTKKREKARKKRRNFSRRLTRINIDLYYLSIFLIRVICVNLRLKFLFLN